MTAQKPNGRIGLLIYGGVLLVAMAGGFFTLRAQAENTAELVKHLDREKVDAATCQVNQQEFYEKVIKPDLDRMETRLLREIQDVKEHINK